MFLCICLCAYQHICILCTSICVLNHPWFRLTTWLASPINWYPTRIGVFYRPHYSLLILCHHKRGNWLFVFGYLYLCLYRQNCITPPFGISLGWTSIILGCIPKHGKKFGMDPKLRPSQTPTIHPSQFFWHVPHSEPNWKTCVIYQSIRLRWKWKFISLYVVKLSWNDHDCLHNMFFWFDKCLYFTK